MLRVHGDKVIRRRTNYKKQNNIQAYSSILEEDFHNMCGYCGKELDIIPCPSQKDHLIPKHEAKKRGRNDLLTSYENLVFTCRVCNRKKWNNWPLDTIEQLNDGEKGFVDPASEEFDQHLARNEKGEIVSLSKVGQYMYSIFDFENRLTDVWWKISQIEKLINEIDQMIEEDESLENLRKYRMLHKEYKRFINLLKEKKEMI